MGILSPGFLPALRALSALRVTNLAYVRDL
jgi:hypothetical protein